MNPETEALTLRYGRIINGLFQAISAHNHVLSAWLFPVINTLYRRTHMRVVKLLEKLRAGTYRQPRPRTTPRPPPATKPARAPGPVVPEGQPHPSTWRWLIRLLPPASAQAASAAATELAQLLEEPGMAALFTSVPALRHHLRPLCRALGLALPGEPPPTPPEHDPPTPPPAPPITPLPFGAELVHGRAPAPAPKPAPILGPPRYRYRLVPFFSVVTI